MQIRFADTRPAGDFALVLPVAGKWTLTVTVQVAGSTAPITFTQAIPITN